MREDGVEQAFHVGEMMHQAGGRHPATAGDFAQAERSVALGRDQVVCDLDDLGAPGFRA
jgi:hypothetical protein